MSATADRLPRLLALVPYLLARPGVAIADVADDFGVNEAQLRRDLELLWVCGLPGHGPGDLIDLSFEGETVSVTYDAGMSRPLRLTSDEALSLLVALRTLADVPGLAGRDAVGRALAKVEAAAGEAADAARGVAVQVEATEQTLALLNEAVDAGRALHLSYYVATRDESTERDVDPMRLLLVSGRTYLEAWCRRAEGVRLFRLDRIDDARILDEPSRPPTEAVSRDLAGGVYRPAPEHTLLTLRLSRAARWVADYYVCEDVADLADGGLRVWLRAAELAWIRQLALGSGADVVVEAPAWLADQVRAEALRALAAYDA